MSSKKDIFGLFVSEIAESLIKHSIPKFRASQIAEWLYTRHSRSFTDMNNLPVSLRKLLETHFFISSVDEQTSQHSSDGKTSKYLLQYNDSATIETVLMRQPYGNSICVSTQVGCAMGCTFCASTLNGLTRNLTAGEILLQALHIKKILGHEPINNIVIMGSGEPLANYDHTIRFIRLCHEKYCLNLSYRNITLSTAGLVAGIDRLANEGLPITLSISLHAPNNDIRSRLMPINQQIPINEVFSAGDRYAKQTGRRVTYEYTLIAGINDQPEHARELAAHIKGRLANINLIPINPVVERGLLRPTAPQISSFENILRSQQLNVTVRRERGADIQAACGQLRNKMIDKTII